MSSDYGVRIQICKQCKKDYKTVNIDTLYLCRKCRNVVSVQELADRNDEARENYLNYHLTAGIVNLFGDKIEQMARLYAAIRRFDDFNSENDP